MKEEKESGNSLVITSIVTSQIMGSALQSWALCQSNKKDCWGNIVEPVHVDYWP